MSEVLDFLTALPAFQGVPRESLAWFTDASRLLSLAEGEEFFHPGQPITDTIVHLSGRMNVYVPQGNGRRLASSFKTGDISGFLPFSRMKAAAGTGIMMEESRLLAFPATCFREMVTGHYELTEALVHVMISRVRDFTALQQQSEKMMALGKLSAGLAHELNNPAAAIVRDAHALQKHLALLPDSFKDVTSIRMDPEQVDAVNSVLFEALRKERPALTLIQRGDREEELLDWLADHGVRDSAELAETFTDFGFCTPDLDDFARHVPSPHLKPVLKWISDNIITDKTVRDMGEAAARIETLISSVKAFTHMDRGAEKQTTDIHTGIRSTLTMLGHKLRKGGVRVEERYDLSLPPVTAMVGELNQVWTNLVDNALDAMAGREGPVLTISTARDASMICVTIEDNGPGIPDDVLPRIFDPFFTTKDIGQGTGLGLDVVQRIMSQHGGTVSVSSPKGDGTAVRVCFPM